MKTLICILLFASLSLNVFLLSGRSSESSSDKRILSIKEQQLEVMLKEQAQFNLIQRQINEIQEKIDEIPESIRGRSKPGDIVIVDSSGVIEHGISTNETNTPDAAKLE
jgi:hypothetical protein